MNEIIDSITRERENVKEQQSDNLIEAGIYKYNNKTFRGIYIGKVNNNFEYLTENGILLLPEEAEKIATIINARLNQIYKNVLNGADIPYITVECLYNTLLDLKMELESIYGEEFPEFKHLCNRAIRLIYKMNKQHERNLSIKEIYTNYKILGQKIDLGNYTSKEKSTFKLYSELIEYLKKARLAALAANRSINNQHSIELSK